MKVAYVRTSTVEQNEARQIEALEKFGIEKYFIEKVSGRTMNRPALQELLEFVREGDTVYIKDFSRLSRSTKDLLELIDLFQEKGVNLVSDKENLDTSTATGRMMVTVIASVNEFLVDVNRENQLEGIAIAESKGKYKGGQPKKIDKELFQDLLEKYKSHEISKTEFASRLKVSRPTLYKLL